MPRHSTSRAAWGMRAALLVLMIIPLACAMPTAPVEPTGPANSPTLPGAPAATGTPVATDPALPAVTEVTIYLIALEDNGASGPPVGCGDSLVAVTRPVSATTQPVQTALIELFSIKDRFLGESGLYTALYQSNLTVDSVQVDSNGAAVVSLTGQYLLGGACDTPRFQSQIEQTILAAPGVTSTQVFLNGQAIEQALSER